jgi:hypothetical protein
LELDVGVREQLYAHLLLHCGEGGHVDFHVLCFGLFVHSLDSNLIYSNHINAYQLIGGRVGPPVSCRLCGRKSYVYRVPSVMGESGAWEVGGQCYCVR